MNQSIRPQAQHQLIKPTGDRDTSWFEWRDQPVAVPGTLVLLRLIHEEHRLTQGVEVTNDVHSVPNANLNSLASSTCLTGDLFREFQVDLKYMSTGNPFESLNVTADWNVDFRFDGRYRDSFPGSGWTKCTCQLPAEACAVTVFVEKSKSFEF